MIFNLMKPVPTTESATMYLYGHEADKTVSYNGVVLPELPEWDKVTYPYAAIFFMYNPTDNLSVRSLFFLDQPGTVGVANMWLSGGCSVLCYEILGDESEWRFVNESYVEAGKNICTVASNMLALPSGGSAWANHDIMYSKGTTYLSATDPVVTYENADVTINGVGYVGAVLPKLPDWDKTAYPYAVIVGDSNGSFGFFPTRLFLSTVPLLRGRGVIDWSLFYGSADGSCIGYEWSNLNDDGVITYEPGFVRDENLDRTFSAGGSAADNMVMNSLLWANYDVYKNPSGMDLALATCNDPIPIYE